MNKDFYAKLGQNIKKKRNEKHLTQQALADKIHKSINFVGKIEVAFSKPSLDTLMEIATALDCTVSELTNFSN